MERPTILVSSQPWVSGMGNSFKGFPGAGGGEALRCIAVSMLNHTFQISFQRVNTPEAKIHLNFDCKYLIS